MRFEVWGLKFEVWGVGFEVWGLGFGVWGLGSGVRVALALFIGDVKDTFLLPDWIPRVRRYCRHFDLLVQRNHHLKRDERSEIKCVLGLGVMVQI